MRKKLQKTCALALATVMTLAGCGASQTGASTAETQSAAATAAESTEAAETPAAAESTEAQAGADPGEIVDINVMVYDRGSEYSAGNSLTDNELTRWINEQMEPQGVHVNFIPVPRSGADDAVNLMLTAGTAPDVIRTYDRQRVATYGSQGGLVDLTPYMDQLDPDYVANNQDAIEFTQFDGMQYALPGVYAYHGKGHDSYIRQDLVEKMGMEMPANRDELIEVLYAMKENFPDITPYAFSGEITDGKYTNFILSYCSRENERDNYIYEPTFTTVLKPGHKDGLRQLNQFVLDGIIPSDFALDTDSTQYDQDIANGKVGFVLDGGADCMKAYSTADDPDYHMVELDVLQNADGSYEVPSQDALSHYVYVPKTAEDRIDAVVKYLAFLSNQENAMNIAYGIVGLGTELVDGKPVKKTADELTELGLSPNLSDSNFLYSNFDFEKDSLVENFMTSYPDVPQDVAEGKIACQYSNYYDKCLIPAALKTDQYVPLLQTLIVEFVFKCMNAPEGQFDQVYEQEYQILLDNHLQEVLDERAAWYDANMQ